MTRSAEKGLLRSELLEARRKMSFEEVFSLSALVQRRLLESRFFAGAGKLALYSSFANEVLTEELFRAAKDSGRQVFYPRVAQGRSLAFYRVRELGEMAPGAYDLREPGPASEAAEAAEFDLVVVPGVAFDARGGRIGFGKGCYDAALAGAACPIVALAYEFQVLKTNIPLEPHDVTVTAIVTEDRVIVPGELEGKHTREREPHGRGPF